MKRFATGLLSVLGALVATAAHTLVLVLTDLLALLVTYLATLVPLSGEIAAFILYVVCRFITFAAAAWFAHFIICLYCIKLPRVNEEGIRTWLLFFIAIRLFTLITDGLGWIPAIFAIVFSYCFSHALIWRRRAYHGDDDRKQAQPND